jgi:hypothetical protein
MLHNLFQYAKEISIHAQLLLAQGRMPPPLERDAPLG